MTQSLPGVTPARGTAGLSAPRPDLRLRTLLAAAYLGIRDVDQWDDQVFGTWGNHPGRRRVPPFEVSLDAAHALEQQLETSDAYLAALARHCQLAYAAGEEASPHAAICGPLPRARALLEVAVRAHADSPRPCS